MTQPYPPSWSAQSVGYAPPPPAAPPAGGYYGGYYARPPMPPEKSGGGRAITILVISLVVLAVGGIGTVAYLGRDVFRKAHAVAAAIEAVPNAAGSNHTGDLTQLFAAPPQGARWCPNVPYNNKQLSLDEETGIAKDAERAAILRRYHFQRAAVRCWVDSTSAIVAIELVQLGSPADAADLLALAKQTTPAELGAPQQQSTAGIPGATMYPTSKPDQTGYVSTLTIAQRGDVEMEMTVFQLPPAQVDQITPLVRQQYDKL